MYFVSVGAMNEKMPQFVNKSAYLSMMVVVDRNGCKKKTNPIALFRTSYFNRFSVVFLLPSRSLFAPISFNISAVHTIICNWRVLNLTLLYSSYNAPMLVFNVNATEL